MFVCLCVFSLFMRLFFFLKLQPSFHGASPEVRLFMVETKILLNMIEKISSIVVFI